ILCPSFGTQYGHVILNSFLAKIQIVQVAGKNHPKNPDGARIFAAQTFLHTPVLPFLEKLYPGLFGFAERPRPRFDFLWACWHNIRPNLLPPDAERSLRYVPGVAVRAKKTIKKLYCWLLDPVPFGCCNW